MSRPTLSWPISILAGAGVIICVLLISAISSPLGDSAGISFAQERTCSPDYPDACETQTAIARACVLGNSAYPVCETQTAEAAANPSATPSSTSGSTGGSAPSVASATTTPTATSTATRTTTTTVGSPAAATSTPTRTAASTAQATVSPAADTSLPTPTPLIPADAPILICVPGERVEIAGETRPNIPLIVYFDQRAVGGGTSTGTGSYLLRMQIGDEAPGLYLVEVRERGSRTLIQQLGCDVPAFTPTATVPLVP